METNGDGTYFQVGDHVRIENTQETGTINAADGGSCMYFWMEQTSPKSFQPLSMRMRTLSLLRKRMSNHAPERQHKETRSIDMQQPCGASSANVLEWLLLHDERNGNVF
jgi:hypothetical protein